MKQALSFLCLTLTFHLSAQVCTPPLSAIELHANNILARITNGGDLFSGHFIPNPDQNGEGPITIYSAGLWLGALDSADDLRVDGVTWRQNNRTDYFAGPLGPDGTTIDQECSNWDRHFIARGGDIEAFLAALPQLANNPEQAKMLFPGIMSWPGKGNPFFQEMLGFDLPFTNADLAPFFDANQDGSYNPLQGDYPVVSLQNHQPFVADEMIWCVFNDQGGGAAHTGTFGTLFPVEIQLTAWAFNNPLSQALNNTVFTSHKIIFHNTAKLDSCFVGIWADFDIGCYADDYVGTVAGLNTMFAYNTDAIDGQVGNSCGGDPVFENTPPVQSVTFLNTSLDKTIANSLGTPFNTSIAPDFYRLLTGHWTDGQPLTASMNGYMTGGPEVDFIFPDHPANADGWSMCTANIAQGDRQMVGSHRIGEVLPGQIEELTLAWTVHPDPLLPCGIGDMFSNVNEIQNLFDQNFFGGVLEASIAPGISVAVKLQPNPATNLVDVLYKDIAVVELQCFDATGRLVRTIQQLPETQYRLDVSEWNAGVYTVKLLTTAGTAATQLVVLK